MSYIYDGTWTLESESSVCELFVLVFDVCLCVCACVLARTAFIHESTVLHFCYLFISGVCYNKKYKVSHNLSFNLDQ